MSLNDWKEDGRPKQMGDQEKPLNDGAAAESQQDVDFWDRNQNGVVENEVEVVADAVEIQEAVEGQDVVEHPEMPSEKNEKKAKRKKDKVKKKKNKAEDLNASDLLGTNKGVETMFRNAVRSEMELLALAATKANIMISLNGFIVSALMISGAFIFFIVARIFDSGQYVYDYCRRVYRVCIAFCFAGTYRQNAGGAYMV